MEKVKVLADKHKNIISISKNPEYGFINVEQTVTQITETGWLRRVRRTAIINGKIEDLKAANFHEGMEILGKIVVVESLTPFDYENPDKNLKIAGDSGIICRYEDQPIYRDMFFTTNQNSFDEFIQHTNTDEIKEVIKAQKELSEITKEVAL